MKVYSIHLPVSGYENEEIRLGLALGVLKIGTTSRPHSVPNAIGPSREGLFGGGEKGKEENSAVRMEKGIKGFDKGRRRAEGARERVRSPVPKNKIKFRKRQEIK